MDILDIRVYKKLENDLKRGRVLGVMMAPTCGSLSIAFQRSGPGRTKDMPWGVAGLAMDRQD